MADVGPDLVVVGPERRARARQVRNARPGGYERNDRPVVACSIAKGIHRWADPFLDGNTCACGALYLYAKPRGAAVFEVHDQ